MRHMPAAMVHGGGGVLLMMTTKFSSQETIKKHHIQLKTTTQNHKQTKNHDNQHPGPSNKLTAEIQYFQMRKMDQR
jgi:hypothetical protein